MQQNIFRTSMVNGLVMGVLFSLNFLLSAAESVTFSFLSFVFIIAIIVLMYKMITHYRDNHLGGFINYGAVVSLTIMTFFFGAIISAGFKMIYVTYIKPDFLEIMYNKALEGLDMISSSFNIFAHINEDEYMASLEKNLTPFNYSIQTIWTNIFYGLILGLILGIFAKKKKGIFDEEKTIESTNE